MQDWFCVLEVWRNFKRVVAPLVQGLDEDEDAALAMLVDLKLLAELIFAVRFRVRESQRGDVHVVTNDAQALERLRTRGYVRKDGRLWGRNNCLADSLLQLLVRHRVIYGDRPDHGLTDGKRKSVCNANRDRLCQSRALHPRRESGERYIDAYLQHHVHAGPTIKYFLEYEHCQLRIRDGIPEAGVQLCVHTRFDGDLGGDESADSHTVLAGSSAGRAGGPLVMHLFCHTGEGFGGYHYDPLFREGDGLGLARGSGLGDPTASVPVIQEILGGDEQQAEAAAIARRLDEEARQGEQTMDEDPALAEATRRSLVSVAETEETDVAEALRRSLASLDVNVEEKLGRAVEGEEAGGDIFKDFFGFTDDEGPGDSELERLRKEPAQDFSLGAVAASSSASGSGAAGQRHAAGQDARGRSADGGCRAGGRATPPRPSASAGQAPDIRTVPSSGQDTFGESEAGAGVRRLQRRIGHSQVYDSDDGAKRGYRRLRRAATRAPTGDQETDRAVSQGLLVWDEAEDMSTHLGDTGMRALEDGDGEVTPPCSSGSVVQSGLATPPAGPSEGEGEHAAAAQPSADPLRPYYSSPARHVSLVQEPSSPARPPMSTSGRGCARRASQMGAHAPRSESATGSEYGLEVVRRRSARIEARGRDAAAAASRGVGLPAAAPTMSEARGGGRGRGRGKGAGT
jgi:hypothetical protein